MDEVVPKRTRRYIMPARSVRERFRWELVPLAVIAIFVLMAIAPQWMADGNPFKQNVTGRLQPPLSPGHVLGTDGLGRDLYARLVYGARPTFIVAAAALTMSAAVGLIVGLTAGLAGGRVDAVLMRITDAVISLPLILFALFLVIVLGPSMMNVVIAIGALVWARYARIIRGESLVVRQQDYVRYAQISGVSFGRIILRHVLPNVGPSILILATLQVGWVILTEASLSFLGAGIPPPEPSWGSIVASGREVVRIAWWVVAFPGLAIVLLVTCVNVLGDSLRDRIDPRLGR